MPEVTIIVTSIEMFEMTKKCISTLIENTKGVDYEIIVNDSSKTTRTVDWIRTLKAPIKALHTKPSSDADAIESTYEKFIRDSETKYIVFMNNDVFVQKNWLFPLIEIMESDRKIGVIAPLILVDKKRGIYTAGAGNLVNNGGKRFIAWNWKKKLIVPVGYVITSCALIRNDVAKKAGGIHDRQFRYWKDDIDLCMRVWKAGYKVCITNLSKIYHLTGQTTKWRRVKEDIDRANRAFDGRHSGNDIRKVMKEVEKLQRKMGTNFYFTNPKHTVDNSMDD